MCSGWDGEKAEVLAFTTYADSGKMPGMAPSMAAGVFVMGPITAVTAIEDVVSSGQKIYSSQINPSLAKQGIRYRVICRSTPRRNIGFLATKPSRLIWPTNRPTHTAHLLSDRM
jgi:hypothetical protein